MPYNSIDDFDFSLPPALIAQYPLPERSASRMLTIQRHHHKQLQHQQFTDILSWVKAGDVVVLNNTKVIPARLFGVKLSGGKIECLIERILSPHEVLAHLRFSKPPQEGSTILFAETLTAVVIRRQSDLFHLQFISETPILDLLQLYGVIPLPLYIERPNETCDQDRYQTIYARHPGAVAAPTAGLHFDAEILAALQHQGVETAEITLHIGAGTFQPVRVANLDQHKMHQEYMQISAETCETILRCKQRGGRVFAVGTTVTRCLETAMREGQLIPYSGETDLFIRPGFCFQCVDALLTNFHLPKSTLLMLVTAFGGYDEVMHAYRTAVAQNYRFFSYGDAMLIAPE